MHLEGAYIRGFYKIGLQLSGGVGVVVGGIIIDRAHKRKLTICTSFCFSGFSSDSDQLLMPSGTLGRVATMAEGKSRQDL